ncbi:MAG: response regulator [Anaerolineae bacterium]|nr:response regulator [Anaerolineae bacterium]
MVLVYHIVLVVGRMPLTIALETMVRRLYPTAKVSTVTTGLAALELEDQARLDLVISTPDTGIIDGLELTRTLRARDNTLPIIFLAGNCALEDEANEAGVTRFLCQPELANQLRAALPELLEIVDQD